MIYMITYDYKDISYSIGYLKHNIIQPLKYFEDFLSIPSSDLNWTEIFRKPMKRVNKGQSLPPSTGATHSSQSRGGATSKTDKDDVSLAGRRKLLTSMLLR